MHLLAATELHPLPDGELRLLGAVRSVTGAMTRVDASGAKLLVDCGVVQGREARDWVFPDAAGEAHALILTHGHLDHVGSLPALLDRGFDGPIFATAPTLEITAISLEDSLGMSGASDGEVKALLAQFRKLSRACAYDRDTEVARGVTIAFREAGHILGSSSVELTTSKSRVVLSGDLGRPNRPILRDPNTTWSAERPVDLVVMESTYGSRTHAHGHDAILRDLEAILREVIASKGKVFIPAFAIGRTQVLLWFLDALVEAGRVPEIPVAVDTPMGLSITETYKKFHRLYDKESLGKLSRGDDPLDFEELFAVRRGKDYSPRVPFFRDEELNLVAPIPASVLTAPAPNAGALRDDHERAALRETFVRRIDRALTVFAKHGHTRLVLGAWGCGAFQNDSVMVAELFAAALKGPFAGVFGEVVFAIYDRQRGTPCLSAFRERFE